jgi:hypothetical protein
MKGRHSLHNQAIEVYTETTSAMCPQIELVSGAVCRPAARRNSARICRSLDWFECAKCERLKSSTISTKISLFRFLLFHSDCRKRCRASAPTPEPHCSGGNVSHALGRSKILTDSKVSPNQRIRPWDAEWSDPRHLGTSQAHALAPRAPQEIRGKPYPATVAILLA